MYALLVSKIELRTIADRQAAIALSAYGETDPPDVDDALARFAEALCAEPAVQKPEDVELLTVLGLRGA